MKEHDIDLVLPYLSDASSYTERPFSEVYKWLRNTIIHIAFTEECIDTDRAPDYEDIIRLNELDLLDKAYCDNLYMSWVCVKAFGNEPEAMQAIEIVDKNIKFHRHDDWHYYDIRIAGYLSAILQKELGANTARRVNYYCSKIFGSNEKEIQAQKEKFTARPKNQLSQFIHMIYMTLLFARIQTFEEKRRNIQPLKPDSTKSVNALNSVKKAYNQFKLDMLRMLFADLKSIIVNPSVNVQKMLGKYHHARIVEIAGNDNSQVPEELLVSLLTICIINTLVPSLLNKLSLAA